MNIFETYQIKFIDLIKRDFSIEDSEKLIVEMPKNSSFGDISFNAPLVLASMNKTDPIKIGEKIKNLILKSLDDFEKIEVVKPGFVNFFFKKNKWIEFIKNVQDDFGKPEKINSKHINLEFVSANPTGPLHIGHCRGAVYGDTVCNLLKFVGNKVTKEYYVNDYGNQIIKFVKSVYYRIIEIKDKNKKFPIDQNLYPGDYVIDIANVILKKNKIKNFENFETIQGILTELSIECALEIIKKDLNALGIHHDIFISEKNIVEKQTLNTVIEILKKNDDLYTGTLPKPKGDVEDWEPRDQLLFRSTKYGDDIDRPLQKSDNTWTYFANDMAYHYNKIERNFDLYINVLGADHIGYIKRLKAATHCLNKNKTFEFKISQIVKLFKSGKPFRMSKRAGDYILAQELTEAVGKDAARFMLSYRSSNSPLDFDFDLVLDKSKENPVFYVQYASARINSVFRKYKIKISDKLDTKFLNLLDSNIEINLIKKILEWPKVVMQSVNTLEVHRIPFYLYELSSLFHSFWSLGKTDDNFKILENKNKNLTEARVFLLQKIFTVLKNGMSILNVHMPDEM